MHTNRTVATPEEAEAILEYFNGFHDGFIKRLTMFSQDYFEARGYRSARGGLISSWRSPTTTTAMGSLQRTRSSMHALHTCAI